MIDYPGAIVPPLGQDDPPPLPGAIPNVSVPVDGDARGAASLYPSLKPTADWLAFLAGSARWSPPAVNGTALGFTAVSHVGGGAGTIVPIAPSATDGQFAQDPYSWVIKISTAGAAGGAAQYQTSGDGGKTYGAAAPLAAGVQGILGFAKITAAGNFDLGDTYAFQPTFRPQARWVDEAGNGRHLIDHNGYPLGRRSEVREEWSRTANGNLGAGPVLIQAGLWQVDGTAAIGQTFLASPDTVIGARSLALTCSAASKIEAFHVPMAKYPGLVAVLEWEAMINQDGAGNNAQTIMGWFDDPVTPAASVDKVWFSKAAADAKWTCETSGSSQTAEVAVNPVANVYQQFRIELHGSASPIGIIAGAARALFFVNATLVASLGNVFADNLSPFMGFAINNGAGADHILTVGPVLLTFNRFASLAAL